MSRAPKIAALQPILIELEAGEHLWCSCGLSGHQPLCDFSHKGTGFVPLKFRIAERQKVWLCNCKHTKTPPYCDGSHKEMPHDAQDAGVEA
jgi:CDGSH-type Zn-finger protein